MPTRESTLSRRATHQTVLMWSLIALTSGLLVAGATVAWASSSGVVDLFGLQPGSSAVLAIAFAAVGLLIAHHRPRHPVGWLMLVAGPLAAYGFLAGNVFGDVVAPDALAALGEPESGVLASLPFSAWLLAVTGQVAWRGVEVTASLVILLFPNGRAPSRRWRPVVWSVVALAGVFSVVLVAAVFLAQSGQTGFETVLQIGAGGSLFGPVVGVLVATGLIVRYRRSSSTQRLQLKWLLYWIVLGVGYGILSALVDLIPGLDGPTTLWLDGVMLSLLFAGAPVVIGIAILSHRLYDIDLVINRTLVYGMVTVTLGAVYVAGVVLLPRILGLGEQNDLVVAASTLAVAGLFNPLRRRMQAAVDRRFYRSHYDARQTVDSFASRLSQETELREMEDELAGVVSQTVQPASVGVWVR